MSSLEPDNPFSPFLEKQGAVILDGGLATALEARGHRLDSDLWSARLLLDAPEEVSAVHRAYLEAGADCIATVTYQATFAGFARLGLDHEQAVRLFGRAVRLAVDARDEFWRDPSGREGRIRPLVAASVGPYGAFLADGSEYDGRYGIGADALDAFHRERFQLLAASDADLVACETIPSLPEVRVLLGILADTPDTWAWISFSCRDARHLHDGGSVKEAARACATAVRVAGVGVNCVAPGLVPELVAAITDETDLPVIAYPNSGEEWDSGAKQWRGRAALPDWASSADDWVSAGACVVGGCCRVGPETIRAVRQRVVGSRID